VTKLFLNTTLATVAALLVAGPLAAQERWVVRTEPGTPVVTLEVLVATGPLDEAPGEEGLGFLAARSVVAPIRPALEALGAHLAMEGHKDAISFTLVSPPDSWEEASHILLVALFRDPPDDEAVRRERRAVSTELLARQTNPADAMAREADLATFGASHPWGRPATGTPNSVAALEVADVDRFLRRFITPERSVAAVVGPLEPSEVADHLIPFLTPGALVRPAAVPVAVLPEPVFRDYNAITTWVSVVYPLGSDADLEAARFLAEAAAGALSFGPSRRSIYDVRAEIVNRVGGGELRIQLVVPPREAIQWSRRITEVIEQYAWEPVEEDLFAQQVRFFRGRRLLALATPEARARELARSLLVDGHARGELETVAALSAERVQHQAQALGAPTLVFLGPFFESDE
jgi:predicted Zn-dependent peptidase